MNEGSVSTVYFWTVSIVGFVAVAVWLLWLFERDRKAEARRRAEAAASIVAMTGAMQAMRPALEQMGEAFGKAAKQISAFGEAFQRQEGRHR